MEVHTHAHVTLHMYNPELTWIVQGQSAESPLILPLCQGKATLILSFTS